MKSLLVLVLFLGVSNTSWSMDKHSPSTILAANIKQIIEITHYNGNKPKASMRNGSESFIRDFENSDNICEERKRQTELLEEYTDLLEEALNSDPESAGELLVSISEAEKFLNLYSLIDCENKYAMIGRRLGDDSAGDHVGVISPTSNSLSKTR